MIRVEISIRTLDEARNSHVHITVRTDRGTQEVIEFARQNAEVEIKPEGGSVAELQGKLDRISELVHSYETDREMNRLALSREAAPLRETIHRIRDVLVSSVPADLNRSHQAFDRNLVRAKRAEERVAELEEKVRAYDTDRTSERDRADRLAKLAAEVKLDADKTHSRLNKAERELLSANDKISHLEREVMGCNGDRAFEKNRADKNRERAEKAENELSESIQSVGALNRLLDAATTALRKISMEVAPQGLSKVASTEDVIDNVRDLSAPWADR